MKRAIFAMIFAILSSQCMAWASIHYAPASSVRLDHYVGRISPNKYRLYIAAQLTGYRSELAIRCDLITRRYRRRLFKETVRVNFGNYNFQILDFDYDESAYEVDGPPQFRCRSGALISTDEDQSLRTAVNSMVPDEWRRNENNAFDRVTIKSTRYYYRERDRGQPINQSEGNYRIMCAFYENGGLRQIAEGRMSLTSEDGVRSAILTLNPPLVSVSGMHCIDHQYTNGSWIHQTLDQANEAIKRQRKGE